MDASEDQSVPVEAGVTLQDVRPSAPRWDGRRNRFVELLYDMVVDECHVRAESYCFFMSSRETDMGPGRDGL